MDDNAPRFKGTDSSINELREEASCHKKVLNKITILFNLLEAEALSCTWVPAEAND